MNMPLCSAPNPTCFQTHSAARARPKERRRAGCKSERRKDGVIPLRRSLRIVSLLRSRPASGPPPAYCRLPVLTVYLSLGLHGEYIYAGHPSSLCKSSQHLVRRFNGICPSYTRACTDPQALCSGSLASGCLDTRACTSRPRPRQHAPAHAAKLHGDRSRPLRFFMHIATCTIPDLLL
jgi:hypothetical protein